MCDEDPRDSIAYAGSALSGLRVILAQIPASSPVYPDGICALISLIHDRIDPAVDAIQGYVPREK